MSARCSVEKPASQGLPLRHPAVRPRAGAALAIARDTATRHLRAGGGGPGSASPAKPATTYSLSVRAAVAAVRAQLSQAGIPTARAEVEWMLAELLGVSRTGVYLHQAPLEPEQWARLQQWVMRRRRGEPLHYCLGWTEFLGHRLLVNPSVLIPRPETEVLAQAAVEWLRGEAGTRQGSLRAGDLGTGSGAIAIALASAVPACAVVAVDVSWEALDTARMNVRAHGLAERIWCVQSDWAAGLHGVYDLLIANPPYLGPEEAQPLAEAGEPWVSLHGGADGLQWYAPIMHEANRLLRSGGRLGIECAEQHASELVRRARGVMWVSQARVFHDLTGRPRGLWITKR